MFESTDSCQKNVQINITFTWDTSWFMRLGNVSRLRNFWEREHFLTHLIPENTAIYGYMSPFKGQGSSYYPLFTPNYTFLSTGPSTCSKLLVFAFLKTSISHFFQFISVSLVKFLFQEPPVVCWVGRRRIYFKLSYINSWMSWFNNRHPPPPPAGICKLYELKTWFQSKI